MPKHTTEEDFQHFLSYSGLRLKMPQYIEQLRLAYFHGRGENPPSADQKQPDSDEQP